MPRGSFAPRRITESIEKSDDAFGNRIADGRKNIFDIASQYQFSPERLRLFVNGQRAFVQYNGTPELSDEADIWRLQPGAGDAVHIETAESAIYIVNYVTSVSAALQLNQSLQDGDVLRFGAFNGNDGWVMEQRGADHDDTHVDIIEYVDGVRETLAADVELDKPTTEWCRYQMAYNWYGVGNQIWTQTYTHEGDQINKEFVKTSSDGVRGPTVANLNVYQEVEADANTTGLELLAGSMAGVTLGTPRAITRNKKQYVSTTVSGTADAWEPVYAIRVNPENDVVNSQFSDLEVQAYSSNATLELVAVAFDNSKTDIADADWRIPAYHHAENSALQATTAVSQVADETGTVTDLAAGEKFGGYTLASSVDVDGGNVTGQAATTNPSRIEVKNILRSDHIVFLARTGTMDGTLHFTWDVDQRW